MRPTTVTLDFGGTLVRERTSRSGIYAEAARDEGLEADAATLAGLMAEAAGALASRPDVGFRYGVPWFEAFIEHIFVHRLGLPPDRLTAVRGRLFERFADPATFELLPGARDLLADLRGAGLRLALLSNWSPALPGLVRGLGLAPSFELLFVSALEHLEKPDPRFFRAALERMGEEPARAVHVGNEARNDGQGASRAGLGVLLVHADDPGPFPHVERLDQVAARILSPEPR